jgi:hypothetical protein
MKSVCFINGSLRGRKASSLAFLQDVSRRLPDALYRKTVITVRGNVREGYDSGVLERMAGTDVLVFVFPLYGYGLPGALMELLEDFANYVWAGNPHNCDAKVYVVVNCAYPRPELTTGESVRVVRNFCRRMALQWRFAVCIGTGPVVVLTRKMPLVNLKLKRAFADIASDIAGSDQQPKDGYFIHPLIPEFIIRRIKESYEKKGGMIRTGDGRPHAD